MGGEVLDFVEARTPAWTALLADLIRLPSVLGGEHAMVDRVAREMAAAGLTPHRVRHDGPAMRDVPGAQAPFLDGDGRASLATRIAGRGGGRSLVLNAHMDIVPAGDEAGWTHGPFEGWIDAKSNTIFGRGAMDDKAGVVAALAVAQTVAALPIPLAGDLLLHLVLEDETTGNGTLLCLEAGFGADAAIIVDGTRLDRAIRQHAGTMQFSVAVTGRPASVSVSHMGVNAAEMLARLLLDLRESVFALNGDRADPWTRFPSPNQLVVHSLRSNGEVNTVPEAAEARCYVGFAPPFDLARMRTFLEERVRSFAERGGLPVVPRLTFDGYTAEPVESIGTQLDEALQSAVVATGLSPIDVGPSTGTSDMRHYVARGTPCLLYGPGAGFNPHRADEHYRLDDLPRIILTLLELARRWCSDPPS